MIKDILKMGGCKTESEFYKKYPTQESFLEAFPQARPMMEQYAKGGSSDYEAHTPMPAFMYNTTPVMNYGGNMYDYGGGMGSPFDPNAPKVPSYASGGSVSKKTLNDIIKAAKDQMIDPQYIANELKAIPNAVETLESMSASQRKTVLSKMARELKAKMIQQSAQKQMQLQQQTVEESQEEPETVADDQSNMMQQSPETVDQTAMAKYGMNMVNDKLYKFVRGGNLEMYPAAAELPDSEIYRTFPPNIPRLFKSGGLTTFQGTQGSSQFQSPGTSPLYLQAVQQANQPAVRDTPAEMAVRSGVDPGVAYGGSDAGSNPWMDYVVYPSLAGAGAAALSKGAPMAKEAIVSGAKKAYNITDAAWKRLSPAKKAGYLRKFTLKNPWAMSAVVALGTMAYQYFSDDTEVVTGTPETLPNGANSPILNDSSFIAPINLDSLPTLDTSVFQGMPTNVGSPYIFDIDTNTRYTKKQGGTSNQGPMNYGAFPVIMNAGGALPDELKPDNVINSNKEIYMNYLSDNMKRDRLKKFLENNQDEQLMGMMNPQKKKGGSNLMNFGGMPMHQVPPGQTGTVDLGYKGPYNTYGNEDLYPEVSSPGPYRGMPMRPGYFYDFGKSPSQASTPSQDMMDPTTSFSDDGYSIGSMPGSFQSDKLSSDEARLEQSGAGYAPKGTLTGAVNQDGQEVYISPEGRADYFIKNQRPEGASMASDEQLKQFRKDARKENRNASQNEQDGKSGKWTQPVREMAVNVGLGIGNWMLDQVEKVRERKRMKQIDKIIQENRFAVAPTDRGMYMTNTAAPVPPTQQTPVQFTGYNPSAFAKYGKEKKNDYVYLTPQQIMDVISMGGEVEFLD